MIAQFSAIDSRSQAKEAFDKNCFFVARGIIDTDIVDTCISDIGDVFRQQLQARNLPAAKDLFLNAKHLHGVDIEQFKKVLASLWRLQSVSTLLNNSSIQHFLKTVLDFGTVFVPGGQTVHIQSAELKIPNGYFGLPAHQDWPSVQGSMDGVGVWIPLCVIDEYAYPLEIISGSHHQGLLAPENKTADSIWSIETSDDAAFESVCVAPGDVVFFSNFLVHRSGMNGRPDFMRIACSSRFDNGGDPSFISRGLPTAYSRSVNRKLMDFSDVDAVNLALAADHVKRK
ncbi:MAG: ectoine hydroxylase-related dioxygenase (phytanoyl-CoA dioxygenase family) [Candidatus Paceibacteria bacterium]|jgi:ectoine hydroxylase-related dioxygenase (phytanoyl-CoA dioxygenase family)